jgi:heme-degrading monooxygenase HmoA
MAIIVLRAVARADYEQEVVQLLIDARDFAARSAGFMGFDQYRGDAGEVVVLLEFESHETLAAWRDRADNIATQRTDRDRLFQRYRIQVCDIVREYEFMG